MKAYLADLPDLKGRKTALLLTQFFPFKWMGGLRALCQGTKAVKAKGSVVVKEFVVNWSRKDIDKQIALAAQKFTPRKPAPFSQVRQNRPS